MNAIIFGAPGSGKGTYASRLQSRLGVDVIAMGDIFREIMKEDTPFGSKVKGYVEKGLLVPDDIVIDVLKQRLSKVSKEKLTPERHRVPNIMPITIIIMNQNSNDSPIIPNC